MRESKDFFDFPAVLTFALHLFVVSSKTNYLLLYYHSTYFPSHMTWAKSERNSPRNKGSKKERKPCAVWLGPHSRCSAHHPGTIKLISRPEHLPSPALLSTPQQLLSPGLLWAPTWFSSILTPLLLFSPYYSQNDNFETHIWFYHCF